MRVLGVGVVGLDRQRLRIREVPDLHLLELREGVPPALVHLVDAPEGLDGLARGEQDLALAARVVLHEVCDVVDLALVAHPDAGLLRRVLLQLGARVGRPGLRRGLNLPELLQRHPHLVHLLRREALARLLVQHRVDVRGLVAVQRLDLGLSDVQAVGLQQLRRLGQEARPVLPHGDRDDADVVVSGDRGLAADGGPAPVDRLAPALLPLALAQARRQRGARGHRRQSLALAARGVLAVLRRAGLARGGAQPHGSRPPQVGQARARSEPLHRCLVEVGAGEGGAGRVRPEAGGASTPCDLT
mmetsp:Transcript_34242/g.74681  ORF Transcript_34242/g.74681 Transcript_34242/m.74681 type:complete len:301 (+) Transcript_34242:1446-2348(+)